MVRFENEISQVNERVRQIHKAPSFSGPLMLPTRASANSLSAPIKSSGGNKFMAFRNIAFLCHQHHHQCYMDTGI